MKLLCPSYDDLRGFALGAVPEARVQEILNNRLYQHLSRIVAGMQELAECEGIFTETAGGVTTAVTARLYADGRIGADETTVVCITGNGLKTTDPLVNHYVQERAVRPRLTDFAEYLQELDGSAGIEANEPEP